MLLIMPLISCVTTRSEVYVPTLNFPKFPELEKYDKVDGGAIVPDDYIIRLAEYKILIAETEKNYKEIKELYKNDPSRIRKQVY